MFPMVLWMVLGIVIMERIKLKLNKLTILKLNKEIIWNIIVIILFILSYILLEKGNPQNKWNKVFVLGLFFSFVVRLLYQIRKIKSQQNETNNL
jgi:hypothetical protein